MFTRKWLMPPLLASGAIVALCKLVLRFVGFEFSRHPVAQFGWPDPITLREQYRTDPLLFWVPRASSRTVFS